MNNKLDPSVYGRKVSLNTIGEFLLACVTIGEEKVVSALRYGINLHNQPLKTYIIDITCREFELHPSFIINEKIQRLTADQKVCFAAIVFFIRKHMGVSNKDIVQLLQLNQDKWKDLSRLSKYYTLITKLEEKIPSSQRYLRMLEKIDTDIKNYILTIYTNQNGKEKPTQRESVA